MHNSNKEQMFYKLSGTADIAQHIEEVNKIEKHLKVIVTALENRLINLNSYEETEDLSIELKESIAYLNKNIQDMEIIEQDCIIDLQQMKKWMDSSEDRKTNFSYEVEQFAEVAKRMYSHGSSSEDEQFFTLKVAELTLAINKNKEESSHAKIYLRYIKEITTSLSEIKILKSHFLIKAEKRNIEKLEEQRRSFLSTNPINLKNLWEQVNDHLKSNIK